MSVPVLTGGYIRTFHSIHDEFVRLEDYQAAMKPKLPEGYRETYRCLWYREELIAMFDRNGNLVVGELAARHIPALTIWLQRNKR